MGKLREEGAFWGLRGGGRGHGRRGRTFSAAFMTLILIFAAMTTLVRMGISLRKSSGSESKSRHREHPSESSGGIGRKEVGDNAIHPYTPVHPDPNRSSGWELNWVTMLPGQERSDALYCHREHVRTDVCRMHGLVRLVGNHSFVLTSQDETLVSGEEKIKPYTRKWEKHCMANVGQVTLRKETVFDIGKLKSANDRLCDVLRSVPAVVFSTGGFTGNIYHEFNDGLIPLYITSGHLNGEVIFLVVDYHDWWEIRYQEVLKRLSNYPVINMANYSGSHCFTDVTIGLFIHEELGIDQSLMSEHSTIQDFRQLLFDAYPVENSGWESEFRHFRSKKTKVAEGAAVPQLVIIHRKGSRTLLNLYEIIHLATRMGFDVAILQPNPSTELKKIFWLLDRCDVLIGVHGAALTHFLFLRPGSVFVQIVPLGTEWAARTYYGDPAKRLGLVYVEYYISVLESSLSREYNATDPVLVNPEAVAQQGWSIVKEIYLTKQKINLSLPRISKTLLEIKRTLETSSVRGKAKH